MFKSNLSWFLIKTFIVYFFYLVFISLVEELMLLSFLFSYNTGNIGSNFSTVFNSNNSGTYISLGFQYLPLLLILNVFLSLIFVTYLYFTVYKPVKRVSLYLNTYKIGEEFQGKTPNTIVSELSERLGQIFTEYNNSLKKINRSDQVQNDFLLLSGHMLRTPLTTARGYIDILRMGNKDEKIKGVIDNIEASLNKLHQIEENIISVTSEEDKIIKSKSEDIVINDLLKEIYDEMTVIAKNKDLKFNIEYSGTVNIHIFASRDNLKLAIKNIIDNAFKFTNAKGEVKLTTAVKDSDIVISVSDTGIGLTAEDKANIFKKFSRVSSAIQYNSDGLGIGLYVTSKVVELYNGKVWVDSIKGSGSVFNISLPFKK